MRAADRTLLDWLGEEGIATVLRHSLDRASLVRLANARRVNIPGMRNQRVAVERLASALAAKFGKEEPSRRTLLSALDTANRKLLEEWRGQSPEEARARVADERVTGPAAARLLYTMSREKRDGLGPEEARAVLARVRSHEGRLGGEAEELAGPATDQQERQQLLDRIAAAEGALEKARIREKHLLQELARRKFDLNNLKLQLSRGKDERERMEKELRALQEKVEESASRRKSSLPEDLGPRLSEIQEQGRKTAVMLEKLSARLAREEKTTGRLAETSKAIEDLKRQISETKKEIKEMRAASSSGSAQIQQAIGALREEIAAVRVSPKRAAGRAKSERPREGAQRVGLFVDVQNVFYGARQQNARLDFEALLETVTRGRRLIRAAAYVVESKDIDQSGFIALLQQKGYEVKRKPLKVRADGSFKGDWDMEIALDALDTCEALDVLVLVTGDGDFTSLVQRVKTSGVQVEVYSFPRNTAKDLREAATCFVPIDRRLLIKLPKEALSEKSEPPETAA